MALIELLYFSGCPGAAEILPVLEQMSSASGADLRTEAVETPAAAEATRFLGSPTVRVDGVDVEPGADERADVGLNCRIYRSDVGQSRTPPESWIRTALQPAG